MFGTSVQKPKRSSELLKPVSVMNSITDLRQGSKGATTDQDNESDGQAHGFQKAEILLRLERAEKGFFESLAIEPSTDEKYSKVLDRDGVVVYTKDTIGGFQIRSQWRTKTDPRRLLSMINGADQRTKWDVNVHHMNQVTMFDRFTKILHIEYRKSFPVSARDLLIVCKTTTIGQDWLDISCSVTSPDYPIHTDIIRATLVLGGYQFKWEGEDWSVVGISELQFGGSVPMMFVKQISALSVPNFVQHLHAACKQDRQP